MGTQRIKGITIEIGGNTTKLTKALEETNKKISKTNTALRDVNKLLKFDPKNTELLSQKQKLLSDAVEETNKKLEKLRDAEKQAVEQLKNGDIGQEEFDALQREIIETEQQLERAKDAASDFGSPFKQQCKIAGDSIKDLGEKIKGVGDKITDFGKKASIISAGVVGVGKASLDSFSAVDEGYDTIIKKTGATGKALEDMQKIQDKIASTMAVDFAEVGTAIGEVNTRFGLVGDDLERVSRQFLKFAELNDTDVNSAIDSVQKSMDAFGVSAKDADKVLDVLNKVGQDTGISMDALSNSIVTNAAVAKELGLDYAKTAEFLGKIEKSGVDSSAVFVGLKTAVKNATKEGKPMNEALEELNNEMLNAKDGTEAMQKAIELFGSKAGVSLASAIRTGVVNLQELTQGSMDFASASGNVTSTYDATLDLEEEMTITTNNLKMALADLGATLQDTVIPIIQGANEKIKETTEWFKQLSPETKEMIVKLGLIVAALGPVIMLIGSLVSSVGSAIIIGSKVAPIIGSIATFMSGTFLPAVSGALTAINGAITSAYLFITGTVVPAITGALSSVAAVLGVTVGTMLAAIGLVTAAIVLWIKNWNDIKEAAKVFCERTAEHITNLKNSIVEKVGKIKETFINLKTKIKEVFSDLKERMKEWGRDLITSLVSGITEKLSKVREAASNIANAIREKIHFSKPDNGPLADFDTYMPDMMKTLANGINQNVNLLESPMNKLANMMIPATTKSTDVSGIQNLLTTYLPNMQSQKQTVQVILEGDAQGMFKKIRKQNVIYKNSNTVSAF